MQDGRTNFNEKKKISNSRPIVEGKSHNDILIFNDVENANTHSNYYQSQLTSLFP